jgi:hypothetical protein
MADMIKVRSACNAKVVINSPETMMVKAWNKRGSFHLISKDILLQTFYNSSLERLVREGLLVIEDKNFLREVGLLAEELEETEETEGTDETEVENEPILFELTEAIMNRCLSVMPVHEFEQILKKLSRQQIQDLVEYAVTYHTELKMDRVELLEKFSKKNILKAIELYKSS